MSDACHSSLYHPTLTRSSFFEEIRGADNVVRQLQWTARMEASEGEVDGSKSSHRICIYRRLTN